MELTLDSGKLTFNRGETAYAKRKSAGVLNQTIKKFLTGEEGHHYSDKLKDYGEFLSTDVASGIGTVRVQFRRVPCKECTVMAIQHNDSFAPLNFNMRVADTTGDGKVDKVTRARISNSRY